MTPSGGEPGLVWPIRVYYEDTDASGVVYHAAYVRFFERARTEWLRTQGFSQQNLRDRLAVVFTVANLEVDFLKPARLDDELAVTMTLAEVRRASLRCDQSLTRAGELLARARVRVGCVDVGTFKPCALPREFVHHIQSHKGGVSA